MDITQNICSTCRPYAAWVLPLDLILQSPYCPVTVCPRPSTFITSWIGALIPDSTRPHFGLCMFAKRRA